MQSLGTLAVIFPFLCDGDISAVSIKFSEFSSLVDFYLKPLSPLRYSHGNKKKKKDNSPPFV